MSVEIFSLKDKNVLVIGADGILGPVFCNGYAAAGGNVAMIDRLAPEKQANELSTKHTIQTLAYGLDVRDINAFEELLTEIENTLGPIDVLHCNIAWKGTEADKFFDNDEDYSPDVWREIMSVNLDALFFTATKVGKLMAKRNQGSIILTGSIYGLVAPDQRIYEGSEYEGRAITSPAVYSASKAGVIGITHHLASLWGSKGVRVNCLVPGGVESGQNEVFSKKYSHRIPLGRMAQKEDMVGGAIYLASDASSYVTGQVLSIDGGLTCW